MTARALQSAQLASEEGRRVVRPQRGPQELFLSTPADIAIIGGSVYGGKTWSLIYEPLRHRERSGFTFAIFRRVVPMIRNPGGLWDESMKWYPAVGGHPRESTLEWDFPSGAHGRMASLQYESDVEDWKGAQLALVIFDQLEEFTERQFFYLLSRNRTTCGIRPYIRASCNPDPDSFVAQFVNWWIDQETGYAITARSGVVRWFIRVKDVLEWSTVTCMPSEYGEFAAREHMAKAELEQRFGPDARFAKSLTFVLARLQDNRIGVAVDPGYEGNVRAMGLVESERLLGADDRGGNWKIRASAGKVFNRAWFKLVDAIPAGTKFIRGWDKAYTQSGGDFTSGTKIGRTPDGLYIVADNVRGQWGANAREQMILQCAQLDGNECDVWVWQDPAAGKDSVNLTITNLAGFNVRAEPARRDKLTNANPFAAQCQAGNVSLVRGDWNETYLRLMHAFPTKGVPDDDVDSSSLAFLKHTSGDLSFLEFLSAEARALREQRESREKEAATGGHGSFPKQNGSPTH